MKIRVQKWGNSLAVRIPKLLADEAGIRNGSIADIRRQDEGLVICPVKEEVYALEVLVNRITEENRHGEIGSGGCAGREAW